MKNLLSKTLLAVSLLGLGFAFASVNDYAGIPSEHSPAKRTYELAGIPSEHSAPITIKPFGIPSEH
ncbi:hypothetical protein EKG37_14910 [Robertmurraya yapensis]|uniref:Phosphatase n=1 Tax=Bacillus yapensis TaxID=2492960 RepID=A0A431W2C7_9BACI|nr:hypothetical protein [Bacillus yapensis]RTR29581.1 hypothetical protein EKG37_14910 [Bacillus yapensis]TKS94927.1 hypothetical protein FAR12_14910 [Bacillus yapensis]